MAWWDDVVSFVSKAWDVAKPVANTAWDFAKENPTLTGAGLGLITGGGTGDYGSNNFRNAVTGGAAGYAAGQLFGGGSSASQPVAGMAPSTTQMPSGAATYFGTNADVGKFAGVGSTAAAASAPTAFGAGVGDLWDSAKDGVSRLREFGADKNNRSMLDMAMKAGSALMKYNAAGDTDRQMQEYVGRERAVNDANTAIVNATNKGMDDVFSNQKALIGSVGQNEVASQNAATKRAQSAIDKTSGLSTGAKTALKRSAGIQGSQAAGTRGTTATLNAMAGLRAPSYQQQSSPQSTIGITAAKAARDNTNAAATGLYDFGRDLFGFDEQDALKVKPAS